MIVEKRKAYSCCAKAAEVLPGSSWNDVMRKDSLWLSTVQISLSKLILFFSMSECEILFFSGCKSWKKSRKPIAGVKSNCVLLGPFCWCSVCMYSMQYDC